MTEVRHQRAVALRQHLGQAQRQPAAELGVPRRQSQHARTDDNLAPGVPSNHPSLARDGGEFAPNDGSVQLEYRSDTNPARLASYLSKYLTKQAAADLAGAHRYRAAIRLKKPAVKRCYVAETEDLGKVAADALTRAGAAGSATLAGELHGWACNWDKRGNILGQEVPWTGLEMGHQAGAQWGLEAPNGGE